MLGCCRLDEREASGMSIVLLKRVPNKINYLWGSVLSFFCYSIRAAETNERNLWKRDERLSCQIQRRRGIWVNIKINFKKLLDSKLADW